MPQSKQFSLLMLSIGTTIMEKSVKSWKWICWTIRNTLNKMLPWPSRLQFGGGSRQSRRINLLHTKSLLAPGNPPRLTFWPNEFLVLVLPWMCSMEILFVVKVIMSPWTTSSPIIYITLILWVLVKKRQDLMKCLAVISKLLSFHLPPHLLELSWTYPFLRYCITMVLKTNYVT